NAMVPRSLLAHLLEAAMEVADLHVDVEDRLAVEAEVELDGAVRRRVRRPHLDLHHLALAAIGLVEPVGHERAGRPSHGLAPFLPREPWLANRVALGHQRLSLVHRVVLAQRMTLEL